MSRTLSKLNSIRSTIAGSLRGNPASPPTPVLPATFTRQEATRTGSVARAIFSAAFFASLTLVGLGVIFVPVRRPKSQPSGVSSGAPVGTEIGRQPDSAVQPGTTELLARIEAVRTSAERQALTDEIIRDLLKQRRTDAALALLDHLVGRNPGWIEVRFSLASQLRAAGREQEAMRPLLQVLQADPSNARAYNDLGVILLRQQKATDAVSYLERASSLKPDVPESALNLGIAYEKTSQWEKASKAYGGYLGIAHEGTDPEAAELRTRVRIRKQRIDAMIAGSGEARFPASEGSLKK